MSTQLEVSDVRMRDDGKNVIVEIELTNPTDQTLHAYATPRKVQYDPATKTLTVYLTDRETASVQGGMMVQPNMRAVDPHGKTVVTVTLPRVMTRLVPAGGTPSESAKVEQLAIHEAQTVEVLVGWGDQPFYSDERPKRKAMSAKEQLVHWEKGLAKGRGGRRESPPAAR